jgi:hypothetical protein
MDIESNTIYYVILYLLYYIILYYIILYYIFIYLHSHVSVLLGVRDAIMNRLRDYLSDDKNSPFMFERGFARVISGEEEGVYGWLTVNALKGTLINTPVEYTYGALDLGGASTQMTFRPPHDVLSNFFPLRIGKEHIRLYSHSFLYMGGKQAYRRMHEELLALNNKAIPGNNHNYHYDYNNTNNNGNDTNTTTTTTEENSNVGTDTNSITVNSNVHANEDMYASTGTGVHTGTNADSNGDNNGDSNGDGRGRGTGTGTRMYHSPCAPTGTVYHYTHYMDPDYPTEEEGNSQRYQLSGNVIYMNSNGKGKGNRNMKWE